MIAYRLLRVIRDYFPFAVFWVYIAAFFVAFPMIFIFPQITMLLFGLGLASLPFSIIGWKCITGVTDGIARRRLEDGSCPRCSAEVLGTDEGWECGRCRDEYDGSGAPIDRGASAQTQTQRAAVA